MNDIINQLHELENSLLPGLGKTAKALHLVVNDAFEKKGLTITRNQTILLIKLSHQDGLPQNNLAFITDRDKASLARLVKTMENKDLILRKASKEDGRVNLVYITEKGKQTLNAAFPVLREVIQLAQKDITKQELETTLAVLGKIRTNIEVDKYIEPLINNS